VAPLTVRQSAPENPTGQLQVNDEPKSLQVPPFQHGLLKQKFSPFSNKRSQNVPFTPYNINKYLKFETFFFKFLIYHNTVTR
jgi:hypothetical protein